MRSLYNSMETHISRIPTISTEMIAPQVGDYVVTEMNKINQDILEVAGQCYKDGKGLSYNLHKIPYVSELIDRLDNVMSDRFGITFETIFSSSTLAAVIPVPPKRWNTLNDWSLDFETMTQELKKGDFDDISTQNKMLKEIQDSQSALEKTLETKGVVFDLNKAKVRGLPSDYRVNIIVNFMEAYELGLNAQHMTAIILHEVGHAWTHLEYSYRNTRNTSVLLDTFLDNYRNKNKTAKESLILAYTAATGDTSAKSLKDKSGAAVLLTLSKSYLGHCNGYTSGGKHASIDSENLADGFASRFGLGADLTDALLKAHDKYKPMRYFVNTVNVLMVALILFGCIGMLITGNIFAVIWAAIYLFALVPMVLITYRSLFPGERVTEEMTYDELIRRFERVRNQTVKTIRESDLKKEQLSVLLDSINSLDNSIKQAKKRHDVWSGPVESIIRAFNKDKVEIKRLEQITENLMENNLHIAAAKVKVLNS